MTTNILFITNEVRDYIKDLDTKINIEKKNVSTTALTFKLYKDLCNFIDKIKKFEVIGKKKTLQKLLSHIVCSNVYTKEEKKIKLDFFIESLKNIETDETIKNAINSIKSKLLSTMSNDMDCKKKVDDSLNSFFESSKIKSIEMKEHDAMKSELNSANKNDRELFMKFFNHVECMDEFCNNYKIVEKNNNKTKLNLIKNNDKISILELFNGKNVQLITTEEDESFLQNISSSILSFINTYIIKISDEYAEKIYDEMETSQSGGYVRMSSRMNGRMSMRGGDRKSEISIFSAVIAKILNGLDSIKNFISKFSKTTSILAGLSTLSLITWTGIQLNSKNITDTVNNSEIKNYKKEGFINNLNGEIGTIVNKVSTYAKRVVDSVSDKTSSSTKTGQPVYDIKLVTGPVVETPVSSVTPVAGPVVETPVSPDTPVVDSTARPPPRVTTPTAPISSSGTPVVPVVPVTTNTSVVPVVPVTTTTTTGTPVVPVTTTTTTDTDLSDSMIPPPPLLSVEGDGNMRGGAGKCYIIPNLKINLVNKFLLTSENYDDSNIDNEFKKCDSEKIDIGNKQYMLSFVDKKNKEKGCEYYNVGDKNKKLERLETTNLFRKKKINNFSNVWKNIRKDMNSPNILVSPNILQVLKGSNFPNFSNYQMGGALNDEESNKKFITTENQNIKIQYSYQIISLLKKALTRLNNNNIYLEESTIKDIQKNIDILSKSEEELSVFAQKITDAIKISSYNKEKNTVMNDNSLNEYINKHKLLLDRSDKIAGKLNSAFTKLIDIVNNNGDDIVSIIDKYSKK